MPILFLLLGVIAGSFLGVLVYRLPRNLDFVSGRSFCESCKKKILWYDNIPVLSYVFLLGRCRYCGRKISFINPLIEITTGIIYAFVGPNIVGLVIASILIVIFFMDLRYHIILDVLVFAGLLVLIFSPNFLFSNLLAGLIAADLLLALNIITKGKGMGLGDVKLAIFLGAMVGMKFVLVWLLISFVTGAFVGIILLVFKKAKLKQEIAFGPFLIIGVVILNFLAYENIF